MPIPAAPKSTAPAYTLTILTADGKDFAVPAESEAHAMRLLAALAKEGFRAPAEEGDEVSGSAAWYWYPPHRIEAVIGVKATNG